jgi:hypothetical protein
MVILSAKEIDRVSKLNISCVEYPVVPFPLEPAAGLLQLSLDASFTLFAAGRVSSASQLSWSVHPPITKSLASTGRSLKIESGDLDGMWLYLNSHD